MTYDDTHCPCGGTKLRETMLCGECDTALADHPSMKVFKDPEHYKVDSRRHAAIVLLSLSRKRRRQLHL
jgi:hypothetical protein